VPVSQGSRHHFVRELPSTIDIAERPHHTGKKRRCGNCDVLAEAEGEFAIAPGIKDRKRPFEVSSRFRKFSFEPIGLAAKPVRDAGLG
jgi:hypothetical protein